MKKLFPVTNLPEPELYRDQFPFSEVPKILFDGISVATDLPKEIWITDTTFRDGQQARTPYTPEQIVKIYSLLHKLGGKKGVIRQCEFFVYSKKDRAAVEGCLEKGYKFPEVTGWIRANADDFKIIKELGLKETGILTSVSDYHIYLKMGKDREKILEQYLSIVKVALNSGIVPRCHFEDITRADIYGFCLPFAEELLKLAQESKMTIKIRLCDTMGYGLTYPGTVLPRSIPRMVHAFTKELGYPGEWLEWHGHNDFHKVHTNAATAWLHGVAALNASLLGYGERTGNPPLEGAIIEYLGLKGSDSGIDTTVITELAEYYRNEVKADIPANYPFVGAEFNTTRAGIHADGLLKNQEIYNIFDTDKLLKRPVKVMVTDKSGVAGIAEWINEYAREQMIEREEPISKRHPGVKRIYEWVMDQYEQGRTSSISSEEMLAQAKRHLPSLFKSDFDKVKKEAIRKAKLLAEHISASDAILSMDPERIEPFLEEVLREEGSIQLLTIADTKGERVGQVHTQRGEKALFRNLLNKDFKDREWLLHVINTGKEYVSDLFFSKYAHNLIITIAEPIRDEAGKVTGVVDFDFKFEELTKLITPLPDELVLVKSDYET
ncbi:MAG: histone-lysine N-methyltransferase, partial [Fibrobacteres bacterium]|nr:histone-lysine N-methyltransferase [Fibrobacterota bacterium]